MRSWLSIYTHLIIGNQSDSSILHELRISRVSVLEKELLLYCYNRLYCYIINAYCVNHVLFLHFDFQVLLTQKGLSLRVSEFLSIANNSPVSVSFICKPQHFLYLGSHTLGPLSSCPNQIRAWYQTTKDSPCAPDPLELLKLAYPKPVLPPSAIPSYSNHSRGFCSQFFFAPSASWKSWWFSMGPSMACCALYYYF